MNTTPNKFKGFCQCGKLINAGQGFYIAGSVFCEQPNNENRCSDHQAKVNAADNFRKTIDQQTIARMTPEQFNQFKGISNSDDNTCGKCFGNGKYDFANGTIGVCYPCNGTGKIKDH